MFTCPVNISPAILDFEQSQLWTMDRRRPGHDANRGTKCMVMAAAAAVLAVDRKPSAEELATRPRAA
jgi:hypothetical protein